MTGDIVVQNVGLYYRLRLERRPTLRRQVIKAFRREKPQEFWALRQVNLRVSPGEVVGVIGKNGAGKSTLLQLLAGILVPDEGQVSTCGRVSTLLRLGAGFEPELSGRENVFLNGLVLGLGKDELEDRFGQIVEFAELGQFMDAPLKTYSSGMLARLGFSVAAHVDPDILLVDEILSVGDESFRSKSYGRMVDIRSRGTTVVLVSHNLEKVRSFCPRAIWLHKGKLMCDADSDTVVKNYRRFVRDHS